MGSVVRKIKGENFVSSIEIENLKTKEVKEIEVEGLFVYIGTEPKTEFLQR